MAPALVEPCLAFARAGIDNRRTQNRSLPTGSLMQRVSKIGMVVAGGLLAAIMQANAADQFTLIFYDHRCNGRSQGAPVSSMTFENLTADAEELRRRLGYERWAVLGHSFGGHVALEYALRYPGSLSHLILVDTAGDSRWSQHNAAEVLARRGYSPDKVELVRRWFRPARRRSEQGRRDRYRHVHQVRELHFLGQAAFGCEVALTSEQP